MTILKRPMFKLGGSAGEGITSGLKPRQGYHSGDSVQEILTQYGPPPRGYGGWDALTEFGLNLASATPRGNIISTAAHEAKEPFKKYTEGKGQSELTDYMMRAKAVETLGEREFMKEQTEGEREFMTGQLEKEMEFKGEQLETEYELKGELEQLKNLHKEQKSFMELKKAERINKIISTDLPTALNALTDAETTEAKAIAQAKIDGLKNEQASLQRENKMLQSIGDDEFANQRAYVEDLMVLEILADLKTKYETGSITEKEWKAHNSVAGKSKLRKKINQQEVFNRTVTFILGLKKEGGRVGYQGGELVEDVSVTETIGPRANQQGPQRLTFAELRARLPQEISDTVVRLIANSDEALLQFANIRTQQDVDQFNQTYQVDLVLPQAEV